VDGRVPMTCGSGALPRDCIETLHADGIVKNVCFNLEVWSKPLFEQVCPGKAHYVGYENWLRSLEDSVEVFGQGRVYSAMVAGVELEPELGLSVDQAVSVALQGAEDLCRRGIIPVYSLFWPVGGRNDPDYMSNLKGFFTRLNDGYAEIRRRHGLTFHTDFMCHRCGYMQVECDADRAGGDLADLVTDEA